ncbi:MAG: arginine--tRNA ligase [Planctomycetota bacterium]|nr:MAG: arginine--tRNA ligase [Planctomycetota bacterium]
MVGSLDARLSGIEAVATGPYLNFRVDRALLARTVIEGILAQGDAYGSSDEGRGKTIVVDLSSPNIAKPMSVGHLRSTVIGAAIQRLHDVLGYETIGINHIGDWGSQFGKLVAAVDRWGDTVDLERAPIKSLLALYVRYHEEEEGDPSLPAAARAAFQELESGEDGKVRATWRHLTELSMEEFDKIYSRLNVKFDLVRGESYYEPYLDETVDRIVEAGITEESEGALVVDLSEFGKNLPPCLLRKGDGTTLYATRDLAAAFHRWEKYHFHRALYVVGSDQRLHFKQLKLVLRRMGLDWEPRMEHIDFGMMRLPEGKMSTRKGRVVFLEDVLDRAVEEAAKIIAEKNPGLADSDEVARQVGIGAVVFNDLKRERVKDVEFVWEEVLSFEGETGPYVQYTHARLASILRKVAAAGEGEAEPDWALLEDAAPILVRLGRYPEVLTSAAAHAEPSELTSYLLALCRELNAWYVKSRVLGGEPALTAARAQLVRSSKILLHNGLAILGLDAPEEM